MQKGGLKWFQLRPIEARYKRLITRCLSRSRTNHKHPYFVRAHLEAWSKYSRATEPYKTILHSTFVIHFIWIQRRWHVPSRLQENLQEAKPHENSWLPRQPVRAHQPPVALRNLTDTGQELSPSVRSGDIRRAPNCSSGNSHSSALSVKSLKISRPICVSRAQPSWPSRKPARPTSSGSLKTPTCVLSTPREWPSCQRTSSLPDVSVAREPKHILVSDKHKRPFSRPPISLEKMPSCKLEKRT